MGVWLLLALGLSPWAREGEGLSPPVVEMVEAAPEWDALFRRERGWIGSDIAYSIPLDSQRLLWVFGDTFVGEVRGGRRVNAVMVHNSIALQWGREAATARIEFFWGEEEGKPTAFFRPPDGRGWFWPAHGVVVEGRLFLFLWQMVPTEAPSPFNFRLEDVWLARVEDWEAPPSRWSPRWLRVPWTERDPKTPAFFGSWIWPEGEWLYLYGCREDRTGRWLRRDLLIARVEAKALEEFPRWQFFAGEGWVADWREAPGWLGDVATEFSLSPGPEGRGYILLSSSPFLSPTVQWRWAPTPWGPWGKPERLFVCPEASWDPTIFCYAAKAHPALSRPGELLFSYASNARDFRKLLGDARLYFPRFVRVRWRP